MQAQADRWFSDHTYCSFALAVPTTTRHASRTATSAPRPELPGEHHGISRGSEKLPPSHPAPPPASSPTCTSRATAGPPAGPGPAPRSGRGAGPPAQRSPLRHARLAFDQRSGQDYDEPMEPVSVYDAKTHLSRLLDAVEAGEEVVITRNGHPVARLVRALPTPRRRFGTMPNVATVRDDFDEPLSIDALDFVSR